MLGNLKASHFLVAAGSVAAAAAASHLAGLGIDKDRAQVALGRIGASRTAPILGTGRVTALEHGILVGARSFRRSGGEELGVGAVVVEPGSRLVANENVFVGFWSGARRTGPSKRLCRRSARRDIPRCIR